eukprot:3441834-Rhodomonas_salina.4
MRYAGDTQPDDLACTLDAEGHEPARIEHVRFSPERAALIKSDVDVAFRQEVCRSSPASRCLSLLQAGSVRSASARVSTSTNTRSWLESAQNFQGDMTEGFPHVMRMFSADAGSILAVADGESELLYAVFMILGSRRETESRLGPGTKSGFEPESLRLLSVGGLTCMLCAGAARRRSSGATTSRCSGARSGSR